MKVSISALMLKSFSRSTVAAGPQPTLGGPGNQAATFLSPPVRQSCNNTKQTQNIADCEQTETKHSISRQHMETAPTAPPLSPKLQHRYSSAISQNIWHFLRYFKRSIYSFTISRLYSMVCGSLGFHGTLVGKDWCTLQESYTYAISVAVQQGVSDIKMNT
jgi:hypothetical protein